MGNLDEIPKEYRYFGKREEIGGSFMREQCFAYTLSPRTLITFAVGSSSTFSCKYFKNRFKKLSRIAESPGSHKWGNEHLHNMREKP